MDRAHERVLGTILAVVGVAILLVTFYHAYGLLGEVPTSGSTHSPQAAFDWTVGGFTVTLTDRSQAGSAPITSTYWQFSDGNSSGVASGSHTYSRSGNYNVSLIVEDKNGNAAVTSASIHVGTGATGSGTSSPSMTPGGNIGSILGGAIGGTLGGILTTMETFVLLVVMWMVGGSILKAGWNLITPKAETIQVRVKPKSLEVEGAGYSAMPQMAAVGSSAPSTGGSPSGMPAAAASH
ncbi:MAG: PKD domain-containing protein [Thermoplasmata archaeon]